MRLGRGSQRDDGYSLHRLARFASMAVALYEARAICSVQNLFRKTVRIVARGKSLKSLIKNSGSFSDSVVNNLQRDLASGARGHGIEDCPKRVGYSSLLAD